jgi:hypothetical protein
MSVCQSWFGVERSKNRGRVIFRWRFLTGGFMREERCSVFRTVSGLALRKNTLLKSWDIRLMPNSGFAFLISTIF